MFFLRFDCPSRLNQLEIIFVVLTKLDMMEVRRATTTCFFSSFTTGAGH